MMKNTFVFSCLFVLLGSVQSAWGMDGELKKADAAWNVPQYFGGFLFCRDEKDYVAKTINQSSCSSIPIQAELLLNKKNELLGINRETQEKD